jgi:uncharacterized protein
MLDRARYLRAIEAVLEVNPICALLGPRQCGKTTLARQMTARKLESHWFDLEQAASRARLSSPELTLSGLDGLIVIDEIQRQPELFEVLRPLADRAGKQAKFLILGSASPQLIKGVAETLAGRVGFVDLSGFDLTEVGVGEEKKLFLRGGFPRSFLAPSGTASLDWRHDFIRTFLERDIPQLGIRIPAAALNRFWMMLAHYHGQIWNGSELSRSLGTSEHTVRSYLDLLTSTFVIRQLQPWFENISKRQYKSPKIYVRDSGLLHALLSVGTMAELQGHPKYGASWEGFALEQVLQITGASQSFYWATHAGAELDLLLIRNGQRYGIEFKTSDAPGMTKSLHTAIRDLQLKHCWIVYPGAESYRIHEQVEVTSLKQLLESPSQLQHNSVGSP